MNSLFNFSTASRIVFGDGTLSEAGPIAAATGSRAIIICGGSGRFLKQTSTLLQEAGLKTDSYKVAGEPTINMINEGVKQARAHKADCVVAIGGGSVIDAGKAIAALVTNPGSPLDYLEVVGKGEPLTRSPLPSIAIPTTAGTGAEVTRNSVLSVPGERVKVSLRHPLMLPDVAIVDPLLTHDLPPAMTAASGMDALTQVLEPYLSSQSNIFTDLFCREGIVRASRSLEKAVKTGHDTIARHDMAMASLLGGLALANAKLGAVHGIAGPFGGMFNAPHGAVCARLLPSTMKMNLNALRARDTNSVSLQRFDEVALMITGNYESSAEDGIAWLDTLCQRLKIPGLASYGCTESEMDNLIEKSLRSSSMKGNPIELTTKEIRGIIEEAL